ncbi:MAG TPA: winged helix-turn-helix domain-containing protein [Gammaproteobacteria bacterium]|nr:winged helix-turn-helix domain-containing protein [Gammaproteobacteria bacterium]
MAPIAPRDESVIEFGGFRLSPRERSLVGADGAPVQLTRRLYDMLLYMVERPGRLLDKQALLDAVWKGSVVEENTLSRTISTLRQILGEGAGGKGYIETVSGIGYRFVQPVSVTAARAAAAEPRRHEPSVAVLPFEDLSRERDQGYFADGIAEEILARLAGVKGLRLIAKTSSFRFRDRNDSAQGIGRALGVDYLLAGSVRKEGERVRVTAQLVDAAADSQRWSESFDRTLEHIFAIQEEIARAVAQALRVTLGIDEPEAGVGTTADLEAYDLYLRGLALSARGGAHGAIRGAELLREAVTRDPRFARAWLLFSGVARSRLIFAPEHAMRAIQDVEEAAARVMELAPQWWAAHLAQARMLHLRRDWLGAERALAAARELAPGLPWELNHELGVFCSQVNDRRAAVEHFRAAVRNDPLSLLISGTLQVQLIVAGHDEELRSEYRRSLDLAGDREMVEHLQLHHLFARGLPIGEQFRRYLDLTQTKPAPVLEEVYLVRDEPTLALEKLRAAAAGAEYQNPVRQLVLSWWLAHFGDADAAFAAVWRGFVDMRYFNAGWLWYPVLAPVREHSRFPELLERIGLMGYWRAKGVSAPL